MSSYSVKWMSKKEMPNYFGYVNVNVSDLQKNNFPKKPKNYVRKDLPKIIRNFVFQHEIGHIWYFSKFKSSMSTLVNSKAAQVLQLMFMK